MDKLTYRRKGTGDNLVLGTASLGGAWGKIDEEESIETILYALKQGITRLDTAPAYKDAEELVGTALKRYQGPTPFISTKVGKLKSDSAYEDYNDYSIKTMRESVFNSLEVLGRRQLDLLFLHEPQKVPEAEVEGVIEFLKGLKDDGTVKLLGLGGIVSEAYYPFIEKGHFDVVMGFNNLDACDISSMRYETNFFAANNLIRYQGSALHMGLLGRRLQKYIQERPEWISLRSVEKAKLLLNIAKYAEIDLSALAHRFLLSVKEVDWLVLGPRNMEQLKSSLSNCKEGVLEPEVFKKIVALHY